MSVAEAYPARRQSPTLERVAFKTSRLAEFCSVKDLTKQVGHPPDQWPLVIVKELVDNALDACEEAEVSPEININVSTDTGAIIITDNGPGLPPGMIGGVIDYAVRVSSREAYVSPSRGQQGNALKCIIAMPFALHGERGVTVIESRGQAQQIVFTIDRVHREPHIETISARSDVKIGTRVTVCWPSKACHLLHDAKSRFLQLAATFTTFNPHLTLRCRWDGEKAINVAATNPDWRKWKPHELTSAHWYSPATFERYMAAHIARDQEQGHRPRMVRDFVAELRGFTGTAKQKLALAETDASRTTLAEFFAGGEPATTKLLASCKRHSEPVKPERLGLIGRDHLLADCSLMGAAELSFRYRKHLGTLTTSEQQLPYALEVAFAWCPDGGRRRLITGINFSIATNNPFHRLGVFENLEGALSRQYVQYDDPVILILHYTCPRVDFSDHGKGMLTLPPPVGRGAAKLVAALTEDWAKQRRDEMRRESAATKRRERLLQERKRPEKQEPPAPSGVLAEKITTAAEKRSVSVDDLTVLSPNNDPYTAWRRSRDAECFAGLFDRFVAPGAKRHLRGLFYRCISSGDVIEWPNGKALVNDRKNWLAFQKASKAARWLGFVAFERIIDARNDEPKIYVPEHEPITTGINAGAQCDVPPEAEDVTPRIFIYGFRGQQTHRIIFYGEKTSLAEILDPIARQIGAEMVLVTGESSDTRLAEAMARASKDGRPTALLYFADFDPSGHQMSISVARKVQALIDFKYPTLNIKVYRVALTVEQVREWDLPSKPLSANEKRAAKWRQSFGHEQTEIDAAIELRPDALRDLIVEAIRPFYDDTLDRRVASSEVDWRKEAAEALRDHPGYQDCVRRIREAYGRVREAVDALNGAQAQAAEILQTTALPSTPDLPEAAPPGIAKSGLFDSATDFVTATRRLIADKNLLGADDDDDDDEAEPPGDPA